MTPIDLDDVEFTKTVELDEAQWYSYVSIEDNEEVRWIQASPFGVRVKTDIGIYLIPWHNVARCKESNYYA